MNSKKVTFIIVGLSTVFFGFQNCAKTQFSSPSAGLTSANTPVGEVDLNEPPAPLPEPTTPEVEVAQPEENSPDVSDTDTDNLPGANHFTSINSNAFVLICNKAMKSITGIEEGAQVVLVNSSLGSVTGIRDGGELVMVNSTLGRITGGRENVTEVTDEANKAMWLARCSNYNVSGDPDKAADYEKTVVKIEDVPNVPKLANRYGFTRLEAGISLHNLHSHIFRVNSFEKNVSVKIKTDFIIMNTVGENSVLEIY